MIDNFKEKLIEKIYSLTYKMDVDLEKGIEILEDMTDERLFEALTNFAMESIIAEMMEEADYDSTEGLV